MTKYPQHHEYVGTSLSLCVRSIIKGEMDLNCVIGMMCNTRCDSFDKVIEVCMQYFDGGYWEEYTDRADEIMNIVYHLYHFVPFYQSRNEHGFVLVRGYDSKNYWRDELWIQAHSDPWSQWNSESKKDERAKEALKNLVKLDMFKRYLNSSAVVFKDGQWIETIKSDEEE